MITAIHQPNFLPWRGYFYKISKSDNFVFLDNVDILTGSSKAITNRVKIKDSNGSFWLTIPIKKTESKLIYDVKIDNNKDWKIKHLKIINASYKKSINYKDVIVLIDDIYSLNTNSLSEFNINAIKLLSEFLNINTQFYIASDIPSLSNERNKRLIDICKTLKSETYLSGKGGLKYHNKELFEKYKVKITTTNYIEEDYHQLFGEFVPGLSIIDYLFNKHNYENS